MPTNFIPPIPIGQFRPSSEAIASWLYEVWKYLQENPIPSNSEIVTDVTEIIAQNVPPLINTAISEITYNDLVSASSTLPVYRASNDEIDNPDLLEAWNEGCRFALVDDETFYIMIKNGETINLLQVLTQQQATSVISVNGQTGIVVLSIPDDTDEIANNSDVSGATATAALNYLNEEIVTIKNTEIVTVNILAFSGSQIRVPASGTNAAITANHTVLSAEIGTPANQTGDWTVTTYDGYLTISGSVSSATGVKLILGKSGATI